MTEQINYGMAAMLQAMAAQQIPQIQTGKADAGEVSDFQKLLEQKTESAQTESRPKDKAETGKTDKETKANNKSEDNAETKAETEEQTPAQDKKDAQVTENPQVPVNLPGAVYVGHVEDDGTTQEIAAFKYDGETGTFSREMLEIQGRFVFPGGNVQGWVEDTGAPVQMMAHQEVADPEADAMLELTDPTVEHSPVELLEQSADKAFGKVMQQTAVETVQPQNVDDDAQMEITNAEQTVKPLFRDVEAAPIKVGEAPAAEQSEAPDVGEQLTAPLTNALAQGESRVTVRLNPESLGSVEIEITQSANGALRVALTAANSETRSLLEKHAASLQTMLGSRGQENVQVEVHHQEESQQGQNHSYDGHSGNQGQQQEQRRQRHTQSGEDFLQQLRLGLIPVDTSVS